MNLYFLVEGRRTEPKIYPKWISYFLPRLSRVYNADEASGSHYYLLSGQGYPSILNHLENAIDEMNEIRVFDHLTLVIDADEETVEARKTEVLNHLNNVNKHLEHGSLKLIIQNKTIETWLLGNSKIFKRNPQDEELREYIHYYNVSEDDPENMGPNRESGFTTHAEFHFQYLKKMLAERNIHYKKKHPDDAMEVPYLEALLDRLNKTPGQLATLEDCFNFFKNLFFILKQ